MDTFYEPTLKDMEEASYYFTHMEYECKRFMVTCKICRTTAIESQMELKKRGWRLGRQGEFCDAEIKHRFQRIYHVQKQLRLRYAVGIRFVKSLSRTRFSLGRRNIKMVKDKIVAG